MADSPTGARPRSPRVLVVDDQLSMAEMVADGLAERGFEAFPMASSRQAAKRLEREPHFDALVTDLRMPELDGLGLLAVSRRLMPARPVIVMTAFSAIDTAIESIRQGAYHYVTKPFKLDELGLFLSRALEEAQLRAEAVSLKRALRERYSAANLLGQSAAMKDIAGLVVRLADANVPVLIQGETGTGKGVVARAIHAQGERAYRPFVTVNCASLPENLLESELFGHVKGAFTGATANRPGLFEQATAGTLFLDEIAEMAPALQAKLLHVLEAGTVRAIGADKERSVDTRIIAATHRDLRELIAAGRFREDLLYRLDVVTIEVPPLRRRREDIPTLVEHFLAQAKGKYPRSRVESISAQVLVRLLDYPWPGNVRELEHFIERLVLLGVATEVTAADLPPGCLPPAKGTAQQFHGPVRSLREIQALYAAWAYEQAGCSRKLAAERLGVDPKTLTSLLAEGHVERSKD